MNIPNELIESLRMECPSLSKAACRRIADLIVSHIVEQATTTPSYRVPGLGTFRLRQLRARTVTSPLVPGGTLDIPAKWTLKFRCDPKVQTALNEVPHE